MILDLDNTKAYHLYMFLDKDENPLYIGISKNLTTRIETQHFKSLNGNLSQECIDETYSILYHIAFSEEDMKLKERYLINTLNPKYNKTMNK
jgi:excinuclease UvrABC nuclease subunit